MNVGPPDILFFSLFLAAADRFHLRVAATWVGMTACLGATLALVWYWDEVAGPRRSPRSAWDSFSPTPTCSGATSDARGRGLPRQGERGDRLDVWRVREHVDGPAALEFVAVLVAEHLEIRREGGRIARHVDDSRCAERARATQRLSGEPCARRIHDNEVRVAGLLPKLLDRLAHIAREEACVLDAVELGVLDRARDRFLGDLESPDGVGVAGECQSDRAGAAVEWSTFSSPVSCAYSRASSYSVAAISVFVCRNADGRTRKRRPRISSSIASAPQRSFVGRFVCSAGVSLIAQCTDRTLGKPPQDVHEVADFEALAGRGDEHDERLPHVRPSRTTR